MARHRIGGRKQNPSSKIHKEKNGNVYKNVKSLWDCCFGRYMASKSN
jgi:hypothetical protein